MSEAHQHHDAPHDHSHDHPHNHAHDDHHHSQSDLSAIGIALGLTCVFAAIEFVAAWMLGSLALTADAWHMFSDTGTLGMAAFAIVIARRPPSARNTFGYRRFEILAALANGVLLGVVAILIVREVWDRLHHPPQLQGLAISAVGSIGLAVNLTIGWVLHGRSEGNINVRAALAHVMGDALGSCAAIIAGLAMHFLNEPRADPALSVVVAGVMLWSGYRIVMEATHILMEGAPVGVDTGKIEQAIRHVPGVESVHDLHVWLIASGLPAVTAHIVLAEGAHHGEQIAQTVCATLERQFGIQHATIQPEPRPPSIVRLGVRPGS